MGPSGEESCWPPHCSHPTQNKVPAAGNLVGSWQQGGGRGPRGSVFPSSPFGFQGLWKVGRASGLAEASPGPRATLPAWHHFQALPSSAWCFSAPWPLHSAHRSVTWEEMPVLETWVLFSVSGEVPGRSWQGQPLESPPLAHASSLSRRGAVVTAKFRGTLAQLWTFSC